jgi:hypothetical protein
MGKNRSVAVEAPRRAGRRRLGLAAGALAALLLCGGIGAGVTFQGAQSAPAAAFLAAVARDPLSVLAIRSPGRRGEGALLQVKPPAAGLKVTRPGPAPKPESPPPEIAGPPVFPPEPAPAAGLIETPGPFGPESFAPPPGVGAPEFGFLVGPPPAPVDELIGGPSSPFIAPPPGGGLPGAIEIGIPEPSTWAMMLAGFFGVGAAMRLTKKRRKTRTGDPCLDGLRA